MTDETANGPSLIKLGKLANGKHFDKLEDQWLPALENPEYSWRELLPIAGQVGRQGAPERADALVETLLERVEKKDGTQTALSAARLAAGQVPTADSLRKLLQRLYRENTPEFDELPELLETLFADDRPLDEIAPLADLYSQLSPGAYVVDLSFLVPGIVETLRPNNGVVTVRFDDRRNEYGPATVTKLAPKPADHFPALVLYDPDQLRELAAADAAAFVILAIDSQREDKLGYRDLKGWVSGLLGEKGWKSWWPDAKAALKRNPMVALSAGSQPVIRKLRQADRYEDRLRREFDHRRDPVRKLQGVLDYLDELAREEKQSSTESRADNDLLVHFGNGSAKIAMASLQDNPGLALVALTVHAEVAARGVDTVRSNPKAAAAVLARITDPAGLVDDLPDAQLGRVLVYLRKALPDRWGPTWASLLSRAGRRLCESICRGLVEGKQGEVLENVLLAAVARPSTSPELLGWMWRTRFTSGAGGRWLQGLDSLPVPRMADAMFELLDSLGKLYGMSMEEKHLKPLESARTALTTQSSTPLLGVLDAADRREAKRLKGIISANAGVSPALRTQLLGYLRSKHADIFVEQSKEWEDGSFIYTTKAGLQHQQSILNRIIEDDIPQVAKEIGEAAAHGDLSENAEYTAALEKRDQLASTATRLESELVLAKVISPDMAESAFVNVGTRVTARQLASGEEEVYTFLGPWDTDVENRVLNYQAPLSRAFMGASPGDQVSFGEGADERAWEIVSVEPALG
ncbi:MAG: hypothetical protein GY838_20030 [bacterium]|nr:hypothetical protein [bacterium]